MTGSSDGSGLKRIFDFEPYVTNYCIYGEFQSFAIEFSRSLSFLNCSNDEDLQVLEKLASASINPNFIYKIEEEIYHNPECFNFTILMIAIMGKVKEATYQVIDLDARKDEIVINDCVSIFQELCNKKNFTYQKK